MNATDLKDAYVALDAPAKPRFLAVLAYNLTEYARAAYPSQGVDPRATAKLQTFNELQHSVTAALMNYLTGGETVPEDVLIDILFEKADQAGCRSDLAEAAERALPWAAPVAVRVGGS